YHVTPALHGTLSDNGVAVTSFTQADIDNGLVQYHENGDAATGDGFTFTVSDPFGNHITEDFGIAILNTAAPVTERAFTLPVSLGCVSNLQGHLSTVALDNQPSEITYNVVTGPMHGVLLDHGMPVGSFTQSDVDNWLVSYQQNGDAALGDSFHFIATDRSGD